jgi:8-oxoguanine deaminase
MGRTASPPQWLDSNGGTLRKDTDGRYESEERTECTQPPGPPAMSTILLRHADVLVTMDDDRREIRDGALLARDGWIEEVGETSALPSTADTVVELAGHVLIPGLVNTHHHFFQTLTRAMAQDSELFDWLVELYPVWAGLSPEHVAISTRLALTELALSGCTTAFDHHYLWPPGTRLDDQFEGAGPVGIRFHAARGSMSLGVSQGGLPPDLVVEDEDTILLDSVRVVESFHDPSPGAMRRVVLAPCSPFSVTTELMRQSALLARELGVRLHTHLAETRDEEAFCLERFGLRPVDYAESVGWLGDDVWFAHSVHVTDTDIAKMANTLTGAAHCPTSNMRLSSGIAPLTRFVDAGVPVGLGVDGSASNDASHLLAEARQALLVARVARALAGDERPMLSARAVLEVATRGGAAILGRDDIGSLAVGKACDVAAFGLADPSMSGVADPVAGLVLSGPLRVNHLFVHGRQVVEGGQPTGLDLGALVEQHQRLARTLRGA